MQILLCAATAMEIQPTIDRLPNLSEAHMIDVLITGVGLTGTTYQLTKKAVSKKYDLLLQAGIAGSLHEDVPLVTSVVVGREYLGDLGVEEKNGFRSVFDLGFAAPNEVPWKNAHLLNPNEDLLSLTRLSQVNGVTVHEITTNPGRLSYYKTSGAQVESMEGAALHYVALMEDIPFLQLRTISNYVGERDKSKWMLTEAVQELNRELQNLLEKFSD